MYYGYKKITRQKTDKTLFQHTKSLLEMHNKDKDKFLFNDPILLLFDSRDSWNGTTVFLTTFEAVNTVNHH